MAKILPLHGQMSGSIGDNTFSHNKGGPYVRRRAIPTNPNSTKQTAARVILSTVSAQWQTLSAVQQAEWADWAILNPVVDTLGSSIILSGQQAYVGLNSRLLQAGGAVIGSAPVLPVPSQFTGLVDTITAPSQHSIAYSAGPIGAGERMVVWQTLPGSFGRNPNFNQARLVGYSALADATPVVITTPYPMISGQYTNVFVQKMNLEGSVSPVQKLRVAVP